uniref:Putative secreted peptide n=1 Tax=Anopheles braziliensis TaxID=58242 RepID=A0A2M3ZR17_9DIPT
MWESMVNFIFYSYVYALLVANQLYCCVCVMLVNSNARARLRCLLLNYQFYFPLALGWLVHMTCVNDAIAKIGRPNPYVTVQQLVKTRAHASILSCLLCPWCCLLTLPMYRR